ncbi:MAG: DUF2254 family protein, partial [Woeseia sp.]
TPNLQGVPVRSRNEEGRTVYGDAVGYVQRVDVTELQKYAEKKHIRIVVAALPGTLCAPGRALAFVYPDSASAAEVDEKRIVRAFLTGDGRAFDEDPRFGLVVLSEIASRALSPGVNDPGTAIDVIGTLVRLFTIWVTPCEKTDRRIKKCDRVEVPELNVSDMFDDAFKPVARDGAKIVEVVIRLQKALESLSVAGDDRMREAAMHQARQTLARAERAIDLPEDLEAARAASAFACREQD